MARFNDAIAILKQIKPPTALQMSRIKKAAMTAPPLQVGPTNPSIPSAPAVGVGSNRGVVTKNKNATNFGNGWNKLMKGKLGE